MNAQDRPKNRISIDGETTTIYVRRKGKRSLKTLVDTADLPLLRGLRIVAVPNSDDPKRVYAGFKAKDGEGVRRSFRLHRFLMNCPDDLLVDHRNHKTLDNRRSTNLRIVDHPTNAFNVLVSKRNRTSGVRGVCPASGGRWRVRFQERGVRVCLGASFLSIEDAARAAAEYLAQREAA